MYSTCIFCASKLDHNEVLAEFPVGRRLAFDAEHGRLWVVCRRCERWNLTPLEEPEYTVARGLAVLGRWELLDRELDGTWQHVGEPGFDVYLAQHADYGPLTLWSFDRVIPPPLLAISSQQRT